MAATMAGPQDEFQAGGGAGARVGLVAEGAEPPQTRVCFGAADSKPQSKAIAECLLNWQTFIGMFWYQIKQRTGAANLWGDLLSLLRPPGAKPTSRVDYCGVCPGRGRIFAA